jgi:hypothetical protein
MPGAYTVRLMAGSESLDQPLTIVMDTRVKTSHADLEQQFNLSHTLYDQMLQASKALHEITVLRSQLDGPNAKLPHEAAEELEAKLNKIAGSENEGGGRRFGAAGPATLDSIRSQLARLEHSIQNADAAPTTSQTAGAAEIVKPLPPLLDQWDQLKATDLKAINEQLSKRNLPLLSIDTRTIDHDVEDQIEYGDED